MALRLAGAGKQVGLTNAQIVSFAGALSSVGIEAEAGGSAFSKLMVEIELATETGSDKLTEFANVAGMSASQFKQAFKEDAASAIIAFINGVGTAEQRGTSAIKVLDDMGITEIRLRDSILRAAGAGDLFNQSIEIGNKAWQENTALQNEANQRYQTTESRLKILKNQFVDIGLQLGEILVPILMSFAETLSKVAKWFSDLSPAAKKTILVIAGIAAVVGPVLVLLGSLISMVGAVMAVGLPIAGAVAGVVAGIAALIAIGVALVANWDKIKEGASNLVQTIGTFFSELWTNIKEGFQDGMESIGTFFSNIGESISIFFTQTIPTQFNNFIAFVANLPVVIGQYLYDLFFVQIPYNVGYGIGNMIITVQTGIANVITFFSELPGNVMTFLSNTLNNLITWAENSRNKASEAGSNMVSAVTGYVSNIPIRLYEYFSNALSNLSSFAIEARNRALEAGRNIVSSIVNEIANIPSRLYDMGSDIIRGLVNGVKNSLSSIGNIAKTIADKFVGGFKDAMGIRSPSRVMMEMGEYTTEGYAIGISDKKNMVSKAINGLGAIASSINPTISTPSLATTGGYGSYNTDSYTSNSTNQGAIYRFEISIPINGREIARATVDMTAAELERKRISDNTSRGVK
jgi:phage-related protein